MSVIAALLLAASPCAAAPGAPVASAYVASAQAGSGHGAQDARRAPAHSSAHPCAPRFGSERYVQHRSGFHQAHDAARVVSQSTHAVSHHGPQSAGARAGDPVRLGPAFFQTGDAGGVGRDPAVYAVSRRLIVIGPGHTPPSAAREAARRGLARE
ncbi:hypothetical protein ACWCOP_02040 [Maricaulaceae bacterium MS644]